jgi:hypothetical protein
MAAGQPIKYFSAWQIEKGLQYEICEPCPPRRQMMMTRLLLVAVLLAGLAACAPVRAVTAPPTAYPLATPVSESPAAGICAEPEGRLVVFTILPDIPDPRCARVRPDQILQVVNSSGKPILVSLGTFTASLQPGDEHTFDVPFGDYLEPGVHFVQVLPCCGPEIWLQAGSQ